jgi:hypothetical protein
VIDMIGNTVRAFSFKAENYELDTLIDLDRYVGEEPDFHRLLAKAHGIDPYSYLFDALESHDIVFSDATGVAARSCRDGAFDWSRFEQDWREEEDLRVVGEIAAQLLGASALQERPEIEAALLAAYRAGKASAVA